MDDTNQDGYDAPAEYVLEPDEAGFQATLERTLDFFRRLVVEGPARLLGSDRDRFTLVIRDPGERPWTPPAQDTGAGPRLSPPETAHGPHGSPDTPVSYLRIHVERFPGLLGQPYRVVITPTETKAGGKLASGLAEFLKTLNVDVAVDSQQQGWSPRDGGVVPPLMLRDVEWIIPTPTQKRQYELARQVASPPEVGQEDARFQEMWFRYYLVANESYCHFAVPKVDHRHLAVVFSVAEGTIGNLYAGWRRYTDAAQVVAHYNAFGWAYFMRSNWQNLVWEPVANLQKVAAKNA